MNWSGGKDCAVALQRLSDHPEYHADQLLVSVNRQNRVSMHGVRKELIIHQAEKLAKPVSFLNIPENSGMDEYHSRYNDRMEALRKQGFTHSAFGDILLEDLRKYREGLLETSGLKPLFPVWGEDTRKLAEEFIDKGFKALVVCADSAKMGRLFAGREFNSGFLNDLPANVDPCGENGEFHTFVYDGPGFSDPVHYQKGEIVYKEFPAPGGDQNHSEKMGFWYCDLLPEIDLRREI